MKKKLKLNKEFTLIFGPNGFIKVDKTSYIHLIITSNGVYQNGKLIAKGKLKLI